jgi:Phytanoyl-CoA dioxygenase (PhyH)
VGDDSLWARLVDDSAAFAAVAPLKLAPAGHTGENEETAELQAVLAASLKKGKADKAEKVRSRLNKIAGSSARKDTFVARQFADDPSSVIGTPWLEFATLPRVLDVVNSFLKMYAKLRYIDQWYTAVSAPDAERITSQRWHRDNCDQYIVKAFLYMTDVGLGSGPFEYIPGSARGGPYSDIWPWKPLGEMYPPQDEFRRRLPVKSRVTVTGPAGTIALVDTNGFHRGGFATESHRVMAVVTYCSPAALESIIEKGFQVSVDTLPPATPDSVRYALA